jgi:Heavy metal associated domain 2
LNRESTPAAYIAHRTPQRVRLRIPSRRHDAGFFTRLVAALRDAPGVQELRVNPRTASALIVAAPGARLGEILGEAAAQGLFHLDRDSPPLVEAVRESAERMDGGIRLMSGNQLDLRALTFILLAGGALWQIARGQWLAPAATLGWYAAAVLGPAFGTRRRDVT